MKSKLPILLLGLTIVLSACSQKPAETTNAGAPSPSATPAKGVTKASDTYPNAQLLTDVKWVEEHAKDANVKIIDVRSKGYEAGHIPGAIALNSGQLKDSKNNTVIDKDKFSEVFSNLGVNADTTIVLYDEGNGNGATRVFYALEYYGHKDKVKLLNGGFPAWQAASKDVSTDVPTVTKGQFTAVPNDKLITTKEELQQLNLQGCVLLDVRSAKEYTGEDLRGNKNGGHLKNAVNKEWSEAIDQNAADGVPKFKSYPDLKAAYENIGVVQDKTIIPYCQTNVRGAHTYFTLRLLGYSDVAPYEGSWAEWGNADDTEIVK
jgi:thiosulfate/3-mercaptopyruvate sulfurtransferase